MEPAKQVCELKEYINDDGDKTPRPLQIRKTNPITSVSAPRIPQSQCTPVPTRKSSIRLNCNTQPNPSQEDATRSVLSYARNYDFLNVRKQRRSKPNHVNASAGRMLLTPSLELLLHTSTSGGANKPLSTEPKTCVRSDRRQSMATSRSHSSVVTSKREFLDPLGDDSQMLSSPSSASRARQRAVTDGEIATNPGPEHQSVNRPLRRQPSFKRRMISRMMNGLTGKTHLNSVSIIDEDQYTCTAPDVTTSRQGLRIDVARRSTSISNSEPCVGGNIDGVLAAFPTPPKSYATSPTTTEGSFETSRSRTQVYKELSRPQSVPALAAELRIVPEFDQISFENSDSMFIAIDIRAALTAQIWQSDSGIRPADLDVVAIIDNSLDTSPTSLMAGCETARFLASILDMQTDRLAIVCTSSAEDQAVGPKVIAPLSQIKMQRLKSDLDSIVSSTIRSEGPHMANAINVAQQLLLDRASTNPTDMPLHDTYGHIFLFASGFDESIQGFVIDARLTLHVICPGTLLRCCDQWPPSNGWRLRSLTGRGPRILSRKKTEDPIDTLFDGLQTLIQHARSGKVLEALTDVNLEVEAGPDCLIETMLGKDELAVLQPGEVHSVVVSVRAKKPKAAEAWLTGPVPSLNVGELFGELERMLLGFTFTRILTARLSYKHPMLPSNTTCHITETCEVRRFITAPGESIMSRRPASLLETENRVTVHQRLAYYYVTQLDLQGALSALGKIIGDGDGRIACPGYVALLMKEKKFQARAAQRLSILDSPQKPAQPSKKVENHRPVSWITNAQDAHLSNKVHLLDVGPKTIAARNNRHANSEIQPDAARRIWSDMRLRSKPNGSPVGRRAASSQAEEERSRVLREEALRNKRSIGADTLRSLSDNVKSPTKLTAPWM